jgi:hypothetical protein
VPPVTVSCYQRRIIPERKRDKLNCTNGSRPPIRGTQPGSKRPREQHSLPGASVPVLHAQCLLPRSTDGQDRTSPTEQRTTRMLASPCVGASSAGGSLRVVSATCELHPRLVLRHQPEAGAPRRMGANSYGGLRCQGRARQRRGQTAGRSTWGPLGGSAVRQGAAPVRARCRADGGPEHRLAAQQCAGVVQRRRWINRCTDLSAGGRADERTWVTTRARAFRGPDAATAVPRRRASWRSRGRRWRGPAARATARPCRLSAVPAALLTAA